MTIQPLAPTERSSGIEPLPDGWCYTCWGSSCRRPRDTARHERAKPETLAVTAERIAWRALLDGEIPVRVGDWTAGHLDLIRAVATELQDIVAGVEALDRSLARSAN